MLHRYGSVAEELARRLAAHRVGDRLASVGELAAEFGTGRGTVQAALKLLTDEGAVALERRGSLGSFITRLDYPKLMARAGLATVIGVMPVAYSLHFAGLATGLTRAFAQAEIPLVLAQVRGGRSRVQLLRTGRFDFAIASRMAWEAEAGAGDLRLVLSFGPGSSVGEHVLLVRADADGIADGMRVGVDPASHDHMRLTLDECRGRSVEMVEISYGQAMSLLLRGQIDATVWDGGAPLVPPGLKTLPLRRQKSPPAGDTEAVMLVRSADASLAALLRARIRPEAVVAVQRRVLSGEELPAF
ncbi:DNA-binding transcriptional ArsR family regulator [Symbiobacterium terraclitae]|uniref:DNA-binding transcriptional ArsR family regulator n=1 Tax=Symbiobacterium terraclitae TaxID=557451 RepID=A0ABS4JU28_9FIRM|nr:DNA-binding transcriptional ArsR family regulator [Symbiobacterium terraclitae]